MKVIIIKDGQAYKNIPKLFKDDFGFDLGFQIKDDSYSPFSISTSTIFLRFRNLYTEDELFNKPCQVLSEDLGLCKKTFEEGELNTSGVFIADLNVSSPTLVYTFSLGKVLISEDI